MQTGKILGIGAALSAGLLAAHVASASVQLELVSGVGASEYLPTTASSSSYTSSNGNFGNFAWSGISVSQAQSGSGATVTLTVDGLQNTSTGDNFSPFDSLTIIAIGSGATYQPLSGDAMLTTVNSSGTYSDSTSGDTVAMTGSAYTSKTTVSDVGTSFTAKGSSLTGVAYTVPATTAVDATAAGLGTPYTLTAEGLFQIQSTASTYNGTFITAVAGSAPAAVTLPGSGPLSVVGGLVLVGGLAIRRRMKL